MGTDSSILSLLRPPARLYTTFTQCSSTTFDKLRPPRDDGYLRWER